MKKIPLTQGKFALVDDEDFEELSKLKWFAIKKSNTYYACNHSSRYIKRIITRMHSLILKTPKGMETDHIDGNGLNNQRKNLRNVTHSENSKNRKLNTNSTSGAKGVHWNKEVKKWRSRISVNGQRLFLGDFKDKELAYAAYCEACVKYHGEFARLK